MTDDDTPAFEREMTVRDIRGRRIHRTIKGVRDGDGSITFDVEDEEVSDAPPSPQLPAPVRPVGAAQVSRQPPVMRSAFELAMGDPDHRW